MSKIKEFTLSLKYHKNLGNFTYIEAEAQAVVILEKKESYKKEAEKTWELLREQVKEGLNTKKKKKKVKPTPDPEWIKEGTRDLKKKTK